MKRRAFGLMAGTSMVALMGIPKRSYGSTPDPSLLRTTLTPFGAERAGNAAGTIPAWTGGLTETPAGFDWEPTKTLPPDFFAADAMLYEVNDSNMGQYADLLADGVQALIKTKGFYLKVYPTHRTHAQPQWVYDNIAKNAVNAAPQVPGDYRLGFNGAYGGIPFPIIDTSDPSQGGAQVVWNWEARYNGSFLKYTDVGYTVENGSPVMVGAQTLWYRYDYYKPGGSAATFNGHFYTVLLRQFAPSTVAGDEDLGYGSANPLVYPIVAWTLLQGQGRVRRTPNLQYDTPSSNCDGLANYDELQSFGGALDRYDWKLVGKKEMLIPYNNNKIFGLSALPLHKPKYFDPEAVRWELHRVWVVEATLHPGERNVMARRTLYFDEDSSILAMSDNYGPGGDLVHHNHNFVANFPNLPGNLYMNTIYYVMETGSYVSGGGSFADPPFNAPYLFTPVPDDTFLPQTMAADSSY